ncbi:VOC family protein [Calidifontibacter indicus]|uniref:VOC family protein n=1 Tax=Calidifontibacter indicus TaxID=419650 RepID=UPI003D75BF19
MAAVRDVQITFDCADPGAQSTFWCEVMGYRTDPPPPGFADWDAALDAWGVPQEHRNDRSACGPPEGERGPRMFFQKVPEGKIAKNRVHLDVRAAPGLEGDDRMNALQAEADRLIGLGARVVRRVDSDGRMEAGFIWMEDPEGNEFCLD